MPMWNFLFLIMYVFNLVCLTVAKDLIRSLLKTDPKERMKITEMQKHPWIAVGVAVNCFLTLSVTSVCPGYCFCTNDSPVFSQSSS